MVEFTIGRVEAGKKVHRMVRQLLPGVPLSGIHKMIRTGRVKKNGKKAKADDALQEGDVLRLYISEEDYAHVSKPVKKFVGISTDIQVVYEDTEMILVNKPLGLLTHGAEGEHKDTLVNRVLAYLHQKGELEGTPFTPSPVNRLDRNTSGLVLFGKTGTAMRKLADDILQHRIRKWYLCIVKGQLPPKGEITASLGRDEGTNRTVVTEEGKPSTTRFWCHATGRTTSVAKVELVSGRTHQIRAHFSHIGHPLWGDVKYGGRAGQSGSHQWLHAGWMELGDGRVYSAPLTRDFIDVLSRLGYTPRQIQEIQKF